MIGKGKSRNKKLKQKPVKSSRLSAEELLGLAQEDIAYENYDSARDKLAAAAALEPSNIDVLDAYGSFLAEIGSSDEAKEILTRAVAICPEKGYEKYMYLGQLLCGDAAIAAMRTGIDLLQRELHEAASTGLVADASQLRTALCSALCSLAEMQLSNATDVMQVSTDVSSVLERARALDGTSPEPLQALASLRYEEGRPEEALALLRESLQCWFRPEDDEDEGGEEQEDEEMEERRWRAEQAEELGLGSLHKGGPQPGGADGAGPGGGEPPSYEFRIETAKLLLELDDSTDAAAQVLQDLLAENDTVPEVWHLLAMAHYGAGELDEALEVIEAARKLLSAQKAPPEHELHAVLSELEEGVQHAKAQCADEEMQQHGEEE